MQNSFFSVVLILAALASTQSVLCPDYITHCNGCQYCPGNQGLCSNCLPADVSTCSSTGTDPYSTGSLKACCSDLQQCSANFNNNFSGNLGTYQCSSDCACTAADVDTYTTGAFVPCCSGYTSCLKDWDTTNVFTYKCVDPTVVTDCRNSPCPVNAERTCTLTGGDNYCTGELLPCCGEAVSCLKEWYPNTGNYFFKCVDSIDAVGCLNTPYTFFGDYKDAYPRAISKQFPGTSYTPATCYEAAKSKFTVFGLQYGGECWASNDLSKAQQYGKKNATMACKADPSFMCGGGFVNSIYTLPAPPATPDVPVATKAPSSSLFPPGQCPPDAKTGKLYGCSGCQFCRDGSRCNLCPAGDVTPTPVVPLYVNVGCFADGTPRAFMKQFPDVLYNAKTCYEAAKTAGLKYFALQNAGECWATDSKEDGSQYGKSTQCTIPCTSAPTENCGGSMANNVYTTVIDNDESM